MQEEKEKISNRELNKHLGNLCIIKECNVYENKPGTGFSIGVDEDKISDFVGISGVFISTSESGNERIMAMKLPDNEQDCGTTGDVIIEALELAGINLTFEEAEVLAEQQQTKAQSRRARLKGGSHSGVTVAPAIKIE